MDNDTDNNIGDTVAKQKAIGVAYARAILEYLGIKSEDKLYRVQVGAFKSRKNAERVRDALKGYGYEAIIVSVE